MLPVKHPHISTALPHALTPPAEQLAPQSSQPLLAQLATQGHPLMSQPTSWHQQLQGSISPRQQEPEDKSGRVRIPLHKGVGLVKLCIPAGPQSGSDRRPPQDAAVPLLVAKYSAWPFTCLWPESPQSQPPPLPSQSPSPPPMPPTHPEPSHRPSDTQPARTVSRHVLHGTEPVAGAADFHRPAAAVPQAQTAVAATAHRPFGKQAPKVVLDPSVGPFQPASKRQRGAVSVSPDDGRFVGPHASSRLLQSLPIEGHHSTMFCICVCIAAGGTVVNMSTYSKSSLHPLHDLSPVNVAIPSYVAILRTCQGISNTDVCCCV